MLKILQLTSLLCILLFGGIESGLHAQSSSKSTIEGLQTTSGIQIKGIVKNATSGKGISGINIAVKDFSAAISTEDGTFAINVPNLNSLLIVSGQNYQTKVYPLKNQIDGLEITLFEASYSQFYQTAILPDNSKLQYNNPNATYVVDFEKDQWSNPVNQSLGNFLQGRIAGLSSVGNSGVPGSGAYLTLRGFNSLYATNKPLIILDGMIYDDEDYGSGIIQFNGTSPLSMLDVKDIEDVTVLKDGSSLYGTKGANGVIIITTTRPVDLSTKIDFTMYGGINEDPHQLPVMKSGAYRTYLSQLLATRGDTQQQIANRPWMLDNTDSGSYYQYHNDTNWQDKVFKASENQSYYLKIRGGDNIAKYGISVGYLNSEGIMGNTSLQRYNTRLNAALRLTEKLSVNANLSFIYNTENQHDQGLAYKTSPMYLALTKSPFVAGNAINSTGEVSPNLADVDIFNVSNPLAIVKNSIGTNKNYRFYGNLNFQYDINKYLKANLLVGLTLNKERENFFIPDFGVSDIILPTAIAKNRSGSEVQQYYSLYTDGYLNFNKSIDYKHNFYLKVGLRSQSNESESDLGLGFNSATDDFTTVGAGSNLLRQVGGALGEWNWVNGYISAEYNYANKYYLTMNTSYDGSSRFGEEINFAALGSLSAAWIVSSENFMKNTSAIDLLKLRTSIGVSGNDDIGNYTAQQLYVSQNLLGIQGLVRGNIGNPKLKWETVRKFNLGADLALFNERF
ncbi:SusC/RagA family TonB-linked outer membrane protein, partial [Mariniflexile sp. HNIBRBA6329]|uniref:SusC/RagA family TonB-linked outer membrane protein n=1 Tax=Mariniflexile sp. HNIBRBA6329 TaxID=3373088 RepID=UPI003744F4E7